MCLVQNNQCVSDLFWWPGKRNRNSKCLGGSWCCVLLPRWGLKCRGHGFPAARCAAHHLAAGALGCAALGGRSDAQRLEGAQRKKISDWMRMRRRVTFDLWQQGEGDTPWNHHGTAMKPPVCGETSVMWKGPCCPGTRGFAWLRKSADTPTGYPTYILYN